MVFEQHGSLDRQALSALDSRELGNSGVYLHWGLPSYLTWASGGTVYTAVTDAPAEFAAHLLKAFPHRQPSDPGLWGRVLLGIGRLLVWLTPMVTRV